MKTKIAASFLLFALVFSFVAYAALPQLETLRQAELQQAQLSLQNISFIIAFIAGLLSLLSPCILPTVPAFFAYTFKERSAITKMTSVFFLGFTSVFVLLGLVAAYIGASLSAFPQQYAFLPVIGGLFLIAMGLLQLAGRGFSFMKISVSRSRHSVHDTSGIFVMGNAFAVGWSACLGPILFGILSIASVLGNYVYAAFLMLSYSLGIFVPLFVLSFFYDRYNFKNSRIVKGRVLSISGKRIHSSSLIAGILFIIMGLVFIFYEGTAVINTTDITGTKQMFYDWQRELLSPSLQLNAIALIALVAFLLIVWKFLKRDRDRQ